MRICYFIGAYSPDLMGNVGHEEVIKELRGQGLNIEVLTLIAEPGTAALTRVEYDGVPVYRINVAPSRLPGVEQLDRLSRQLWNRIFHYDNFVPVARAARAFW